MKRLCDDHRAELGVEYIGMGDLQRQGPCVVCEMGKVFVCYENWGYEGNSRPLVAYLNEAAAKRWRDANKSLFADREYEEVDVLDAARTSEEARDGE